MQTDLDVLAIEARQVRQLAEAFQTKLADLSDPHFTFRRHAECMTAVASLLRDAELCVASEAACVKKARQRAAITEADRKQAEEASSRG